MENNPLVCYTQVRLDESRKIISKHSGFLTGSEFDTISSSVDDHYEIGSDPDGSCIYTCKDCKSIYQGDLVSLRYLLDHARTHY